MITPEDVIKRAAESIELYFFGTSRSFFPKNAPFSWRAAPAWTSFPRKTVFSANVLPKNCGVAGASGWPANQPANKAEGGWRRLGGTLLAFDGAFGCIHGRQARRPHAPTQAAGNVISWLHLRLKWLCCELLGWFFLFCALLVFNGFYWFVMFSLSFSLFF